MRQFDKGMMNYKPFSFLTTLTLWREGETKVDTLLQKAKKDKKPRMCKFIRHKCSLSFSVLFAFRLDMSVNFSLDQNLKWSLPLFSWTPKWNRLLKDVPRNYFYSFEVCKSWCPYIVFDFIKHLSPILPSYNY